MFVDMVNHPDFASFDLSSLRTGIMAGSPCPAALMKRVIEDMGAKDVRAACASTITPLTPSLLTPPGHHLLRHDRDVSRLVPDDDD